jgi:hypothetical protein
MYIGYAHSARNLTYTMRLVLFEPHLGYFDLRPIDIVNLLGSSGYFIYQKI